jgi:EF hand
MRLKTLVAVAAAFVVPLLTQAQSGKASSGTSAGATAPRSGGAMFKDLDKNKDGYISRYEAKGMPYDKFSKLDKDGDGKLSPSEHAAASRAGATSGSTAMPKKQ